MARCMTNYLVIKGLEASNPSTEWLHMYTEKQLNFRKNPPPQIQTYTKMDPILALQDMKHKICSAYTDLKRNYQ